MDKVLANNKPRNGLHGTGPLNLHSPAMFLSTELICRFARIETDVEVFITLARLSDIYSLWGECCENCRPCFTQRFIKAVAYSLLTSPDGNGVHVMIRLVCIANAVYLAVLLTQQTALLYDSGSPHGVLEISS